MTAELVLSGTELEAVRRGLTVDVYDNAGLTVAVHASDVPCTSVDVLYRVVLSPANVHLIGREVEGLVCGDAGIPGVGWTVRVERVPA